ncbi:PREDICTED: vesicle-associated protein 4-2-like isoform X1 [Tarenaya hassleriana]|uniref:vesicle-associated protein 4-2-like isoform X1 n=1 Tax=Tarenaya hassleriana TaxID=28532 RepID=UPI0008FD3D4E|nr:PREDICTED: vesicle-associated protein 4-2-like isoform X1 [Tarenaya hassleriana]
MAVTEEKPASDGGCWGFFKMPFRHSGGTSSSAFTLPSPSGASASASSSVESESACHSFSVAKSFLPTKRRLKLDPATKLYFPYEPVRIQANLMWLLSFKQPHQRVASCGHLVLFLLLGRRLLQLVSAFMFFPSALRILRDQAILHMRILFMFLTETL